MVMRTFRSTRRLVALATAIGVSAALAVALLPGAEGATAPCRVVNVRTGAVSSTLQPAIAQAAGGDTLRISGVCVGTFGVGKRLTLVGVGESPTLTARRAGTTLTNAGATLVLGGALRVTGGKAGNGGGIYNRVSSTGAIGSLTLRDQVQVSGNTATYSGGGIWNDGGKLVMTGSSRVSGNTVTGTDEWGGTGGGVYSNMGDEEYGVVTLNGKARITGNTAAYGGGMYTEFSTVRITGQARISGNTAHSGAGISVVDPGPITLAGYAAISGNRATESGGGIDSWFGEVTVTDHARITGNTAPQGGGINNSPGTVALRGWSSVTGNTATDGGGVYNWQDLTVTDSATIANNTAEHGAGIWGGEESRSILIGSSRVQGNEATLGGGLYNDHGIVTMASLAKVMGNTASTSGGGIWTSGGTLNNVVPGAGGNVFGNVPDDVFSQP